MGTAIMTVGILLMTRLEVDTPYWQVSIYAILVGAGLGLSMQTIVIALQNSVEFPMPWAAEEAVGSGGRRHGWRVLFLLCVVCVGFCGSS